MVSVVCSIFNTLYLKETKNAETFSCFIDDHSWYLVLVFSDRSDTVQNFQVAMKSSRDLTLSWDNPRKKSVSQYTVSFTYLTEIRYYTCKSKHFSLKPDSIYTSKNQD